MEKQTIGQFLSALRRSNGYTQQEVAEKLGVSNKTVSCWERDSCYPDISLIPAIAELYGVTCDEILRAKRAPVQPAEPPKSEAEAAKAKANEEKAQKEASAIFDNMLARYDNTHKIATSVAIFITFMAVAMSFLILELTNDFFVCFCVIVPILAITLFAYALVQYRINFAVSDDQRAFNVRKKLYFRKKRATDLIILVLVYYLPYSQSFTNTSFYIAYGIACVVFAFFLILLAEQIRRYYNSAYYSPEYTSGITKKALTLVIVISVSLISIFSFQYYIESQPLKEDYYGSGKNFVENIDNLEKMLTSSDLPEAYEKANFMPSVTDQYEEYRYTVAKEDYDESDLIGYIGYRAFGYTTDKDLTVYVMYPVWTVNYYVQNPLTGEITEQSKKITVYNGKYCKAYLTSNPDGTFYISYFDSQNAYEIKLGRDKEYTLKFATVAAIISLIVYGIACEAFKEFEKRKKAKASATASQGGSENQKPVESVSVDGKEDANQTSDDKENNETGK